MELLYTLVALDPMGATPPVGVAMDSSGNLFSVTTGFNGTVFEIDKTPSGYASTPTTLASFAGIYAGSTPNAGLIIDAAGDLFGTSTEGGSKIGGGTVFEIVKSAGGYSGTPKVLAAFSDSPG